MQKTSISIILVKPEYDENLGYIARAMANFGFSNLILVSPRANQASALARSRAMHGYSILENARVYNSLEEALDGFGFSIATSAKLSKERKMKRVAISLEECATKFSNANCSFAIVFGPESSGLDNSEIALCDMLMHIPASDDYPTLNISHAVALTLYEFSKHGKPSISGIPLRPDTKETLLSLFRELIDYSKPKIKNKQETFKAFRSMISRALLTEKEARSTIAVFSGCLKRLKRKSA